MLGLHGVDGRVGWQTALQGLPASLARRPAHLGMPRPTGMIPKGAEHAHRHTHWKDEAGLRCLISYCIRSGHRAQRHAVGTTLYLPH